MAQRKPLTSENSLSLDRLLNFIDPLGISPTLACHHLPSFASTRSSKITPVVFHGTPVFIWVALELLLFGSLNICVFFIGELGMWVLWRSIFFTSFSAPFIFHSLNFQGVTKEARERETAWLNPLFIRFTHSPLLLYWLSCFRQLDGQSPTLACLL